MISITVAICTRDRARHLRRSLESLSRLPSCSIEWSILVVDNGSRDETARVANEFSQTLPLRCIEEPHTGLARARNRALAAAETSHTIFIDDDVTVPPGWLTAYATAFARYPAAAFFGGPITSHVRMVSRRRLQAVKDAIPGALSSLEPDLPESVLVPGAAVLPWGANMALRQSAVPADAFDVNLGRGSGPGLGSGEETALFKNLLDAGHTGVWLPGARLDHHVARQRCFAPYIAEFCRGIGWFEGYLEARADAQDADAVLRRVRQNLEQHRARYRQLRFWHPLAQRLAVLRDFKTLEGFEEGFVKTLDGQPISSEEVRQA